MLKYPADLVVFGLKKGRKEKSEKFLESGDVLVLLELVDDFSNRALPIDGQTAAQSKADYEFAFSIFNKAVAHLLRKDESPFLIELYYMRSAEEKPTHSLFHVLPHLSHEIKNHAILFPKTGSKQHPIYLTISPIQTFKHFVGNCGKSVHNFELPNLTC